MRYLHTMVRVADLDAAIDFYCAKLGLKELRRIENKMGRFTLVFLATPEDAEKGSGDGVPMVELTYKPRPRYAPGGADVTSCCRLPIQAKPPSRLTGETACMGFVAPHPLDLAARRITN